MAGSVNLWAFVALYISINHTSALNIAGNANNVAISRRDFALRIPAATGAATILAGSTSASPAYAATPSSPIADRFQYDILTSPPITAGIRNTGHENL